MKTLGSCMIVILVLTATCSLALGQPAEAPAAPAAVGGPSGLAVLGACFGAALTIVGGAMGIGRIGANATESIARQPEAAAQMFLAWLLPAAMIEGAMLFAVVVCLLVVV